MDPTAIVAVSDAALSNTSTTLLVSSFSSGHPAYPVAVAVTALAAATALAGFGILHMFFLEAWTDWLYYEKKWLRRQQPLGKVDKSERNLFENFTDLFCMITPVMFILAPTFLDAISTNTLSLAFEPLNIFLGTVAIYLCFDVIYFFVHRAFHVNPYLYSTIHKRHHSDLPVHLYLTAKATYIENLLAVTPGLCLWVYGLIRLSSPSLNLWTTLLPSLTLVMEFNIGHCGYLDSPWLFITSPLGLAIKALPFARWTASEHEVHHLTLRKNYAPVFSFLDRLSGSHEVPDYGRFETAETMEGRWKGKTKGAARKVE
ncbi:Cholesterol 25-hydroxylase-like protein [Irineochytrium annulatum]|nr:Cholesterol 25-hydroxylase-like protein [Irineochytrium annulatum]